jgi:hypothetical protein
LRQPVGVFDHALGLLWDDYRLSGFGVQLRKTAECDHKQVRTLDATLVRTRGQVLQKGNYQMERRQHAAIRTGESSRAIERFARLGA